MKILQASTCFYPAEAYGGPVPVVYNVSKGLVRKGHEVVVYTTDTLDSSSRQKVRHLEMEGIKVHYFRNLSNNLAWHRFFFAPGMLCQLRKEIKTFDIIHLQLYRDFQSVFIYYYARKHNVPYILQAHGSVPAAVRRVKLKKGFDAIFGHRMLRDASKLVALTAVESKQYKSAGVSEDRIEIMPNGIEISAFADLPARGEFRLKRGLKNSQKVVLYLGRISRPKGLELMARAFADISRKLSQVKLVVAGPDDGYLPTLKKLVKELEIEDSVLFTGPLYNREKLAAYVDADVFVLPSIYETFPVGVLEACACGLPVVVTDRCDIGDLINDQVGLVVPYDEHQLSGAIMRILCDDQIRQRFSENGKVLVREKFDWSRIVDQLEAIYQTVLTKATGDE